MIDQTADRSSPFLLVLLVLPLLAPGAAWAERYPAAVWPSEYTSLPIGGGPPATAIDLRREGVPNGAIGVHRMELPFPFRFYEVQQASLNIGPKGYVTFGEDPIDHFAAGNSPASLLNTNLPFNLIAAWWGDHFCEPGRDVRSQLLGDPGDRRLVIEWSCVRNGSTQANETGFRAQVSLYERAAPGADNPIRVSYDTVEVGAENDWSTVSWGLKPEAGAGQGQLGPAADGTEGSCSPQGGQQGTPKCRALDHFPSRSTIQYGLSPALDLIAEAAPGPLTLTATELDLQVETTLRNIGSQAAGGVAFDLWLSPRPLLDRSATDSILAYRHPAQESVPGGGQRVVDDRFSLPAPATGRYHVCTDVDPDRVLDEADVSNNALCSRQRITVGPDLHGRVSAPLIGTAGEKATLSLYVENLGSAAAPPFRIRLSVVPIDPLPGIASENFFETRLEGLDASASRTQVFEVALPHPMRNPRYRIGLSLDPGQEIPDADRTNNFSTSLEVMSIKRPEVRLSRHTVDLRLPEGCFYGAPVEASFELCNLGDAEAWGFHPSVVMGDSPQVSLGTDVPAATSPSFCFTPDSPNHQPCADVDGKAPHCVASTCRIPCTSGSDCPGSLRCGDDPQLEAFLGQSGAKSCMNYLGTTTADRCRTFQVQGSLPLVDESGALYLAGERHFHFTDDVLGALSEEFPDVYTLGTVYECAEELPDLLVTHLSPPARLVAGKASPITRVIRNQGFIERPRSGERPSSLDASYAYFIGPTPDISPLQIPLGFTSPGPAGVVSLGKMDEHLGSDQVVPPPETTPGEYYLGVVLDPRGEHRELSKRNNVFVHPQKIRVEPADLRILTRSIPPATLGAQYVHQLVGGGGAGLRSWSAWALPPGLTLDESGLIHGTAVAEGSFPIEVRLVAGDLVDRRTLVLRVLPARGSLEIRTSELPAARNGAPYGGGEEGVPLAAGGGAPPYVWGLEEGRLPEGLSLAPEGVIRGQVTSLAVSADFQVRVDDSAGNRVRGALRIDVLGPDHLRIDVRILPIGLTAEPYLGCIGASGGAAGATYEWEVDPATIPPGLEAEERAGQICLVGTPNRCGNHSVSVQVGDGQGQRVHHLVPLSIECEPLRLLDPSLPSFRREQAVEHQLRVAGRQEGSTVTFRVIQGELLSGLSLSGDGRISGTIAAEASLGLHHLTIELSDPEGRRGLGAVVIAVEADPPPWNRQKIYSGGCSGTLGSDAGASAALLLFAALFLHRRRLQPATPSRRPGAPGAGSLWMAVVSGVFLLGVADCGSSSATVGRPPCEAVTCEAGLRCDDGDGICKCGGNICGPDEFCDLDPTPSCVTSRCTFVDCERGQRCDPSSGACICGASSLGASSCEADERCVDQRCVPDDACAGIHCPGGQICDPADGSCRCAGEICGDGEACLDGVCTRSLCLGVHCSRNDVCDPADGICRCGGLGGPICPLGEACLPSDEGPAFACAAADLCADVICEGGTSCDPVDGTCRCGAAGSLCGEEQSCIDGACRGGRLCVDAEGADLRCDGILACDPADGVCKCGGAVGEVCGEGTSCALLDTGSFVCAKNCTPLAGSACSMGEACYFSVAGAQPTCMPAGFLGPGQPCMQAHDCAPDHLCTAAKECRPLCDVRDGDEGCEAPATCYLLDASSSIGYCRPP